MLSAFLILHGIVCIITGILLVTKKLPIRTMIFPTVVFVPVFGFLIFVAELVIYYRGKMATKEIGLEKLKISEAKYRHIEVEREEHSSMVVPLEEAIVVNDAKTRRKLMLDVLHKNPEDYIDLLQRARLTDDTELTHYATTTMLEIQSRYEQNIRELEQKLTEEEEIEKRSPFLRKLRRELQTYIKSGLITGNILMIYRKKLGEVLEELTEWKPHNKTYALARIENHIEQEEYEEANGQLKAALEKWQEDEQVYKLLIRYYHATCQGEMIQKTLLEIEEKGIYLSSEGKKWFHFWKNKEYRL